MPSLRARLEAAFRRIDGLVEAESAFQEGPAWWANGKQVAEFEGDDAIDVRLTRPLIAVRRAELKRDSRVTLRRSGADWLLVRFASHEDLAFVESLVREAVTAHAPPPGVLPKLPPTGADLARRRRFH